MTGARASDPGNPKYRICMSQDSGRKTIFFCDWDVMHSPTDSFLGKPLYFQGPITAGLSFPVKEVSKENYVDLSKLTPQSTYLPDVALKVICANLSPDLLLDNSSSPLQTLCLVKMDAVSEEISATDAIDRVLLAGTEPARVLADLLQIIPQSCRLGLVGYHALNPLHQDTELDIVVMGEDLEDLTAARRVTESLEPHRENRYVRTLWPLTRRTRQFGPIDFFFSTRHAPSALHEYLAEAEVLDWHYEFEDKIVDDAMSILAAPAWKLQGGAYLITVDGALRARFRNGNIVTGIGLLARTRSDDTAIVVQASTSIGVVR